MCKKGLGFFVFGTWGLGPSVETVGAPFRSSSFGGRRKQKQHLLRSHRSLVPPRRDGQALSSPGRRPLKQRHLESKSSPSITQPSSLRNDGDAGLHAHRWGIILTEWPDARASTQCAVARYNDSEYPPSRARCPTGIAVQPRTNTSATTCLIANGDDVPNSAKT